MDLLNSPLDELERMGSTDNLAMTGAGSMQLSPEHFKMNDEYHDILIKEQVPVRDKKSTNYR